VRGGYNFEFRYTEYPCSIVNLTRGKVKLRIDGLDERRIETGAIKVDMSNIINREKWGLCQLKEEGNLSKRLLLFGNSEISGGVQTECKFENENLNSEQKQAIEYAVGVYDVYLIWGPPGTGKTTIVPEIVSNHIGLHQEGNQKILVCSYTNKAVDNVVKKLFDNNRFRDSIVRFGDSTLTGKYKDTLFDEQLKKKRKEIEKELGGFKEKINLLFREKEKIEKERLSKSKEAEKVEKDKEVIKGEIEALNAEVSPIKEQITEKERSLLKTTLEREIDRINVELQEYRDNLNELQIKEEEINEEIERVEIEVSRLNREISGIREQLNKLKKKETDIANIIRIVDYYRECTKRNKIAALWNKYVFKRRNPLYEQYEQAIIELQLSRRNRNELEKIVQEKSEEQKREQEKITKLQSDVNTREYELMENEKELTRKKEELSSIEKSHASLSGNIERGKKKLEELKRNIDSLARGELEYDRKALRREDPELRELYHELSKKQSAKEQKEADLVRIVQKRSFLDGMIEKLKDSASGIVNKIKAMKEEMQRETERRIEKARLAILNEKRIIATTNLRACDKLFENIKFDLVIMDEAGAIDLPGAAIPILKGNKLILLGDPYQLPPILSEKIREIRQFLVNNPGLRASIFEKLLKPNYENNQAIMLKSQYRMRKGIADFISSTFYDSELNTPREIEERLRPSQAHILSNRYPMICFPRRFWTDYENSSAFSINEIRFVKNIIKRFKEMYGDDIVDDIAIISPYRAQTNRIIEEIPYIDCGTVHTFQGQEKRIIIFATAKYRRDRNRGFGYLLEGEKCKNLLNVAVSRAREKFIIIGSKELFEEVEIYRKLYEHIQSVGYVAPAHISGYDLENRCEMCGEVISERYRFCKGCLVLHRLRNFLDERPRTWRAADGDLLRSSEEVRIDDWFHRNGIEHEVERRVPVNKLMYCDWFLSRGEIYVEYWGLMDEEWYREARRVKEDLYRQANLRLISIEREDMRNLDEILRQKFRVVLNQ
jgi:superfamily I DNA and/or RNA helicase